LEGCSRSSPEEKRGPPRDPDLPRSSAALGWRLRSPGVVCTRQEDREAHRRVPPMGDGRPAGCGPPRLDGAKMPRRSNWSSPPCGIVAFWRRTPRGRGELYVLDLRQGNDATSRGPSKGQDKTDFPTRSRRPSVRQHGRRKAGAGGVVPFAINAEQWSDQPAAGALGGSRGRLPIFSMRQVPIEADHLLAR